MWRLAFEATQTEQRIACRALVAAILEQCIADLRSARGSVLEDAVRYFVEPAGELARWHADAIGLDLGAVRARARALLEDRFGRDEAERFWTRGSAEPEFRLPRRRRVRRVA